MNRYYGDWVFPTQAEKKSGPGGPILGVIFAALAVAAFFYLPAVLGLSGGGGGSTRTIDQAKAATVLILVKTEDGSLSGSGAIISPDGNIITNKHVADKAQEIKVVVGSGTEEHKVYPAKLIEISPAKLSDDEHPEEIGNDWAVLKIVAKTGTSLPYLPIADTQKLKQSLYPCVALGYPLSSLVATDKERGPNIKTSDGKVTRYDTVNEGTVRLTHSCALIPGNSGGPLINQKGQIIGINTQILRPDVAGSAENYSIPAHSLSTVWKKYAKEYPK